MPNIRGGILSASVLAIALVLGEYTISSLLSFNTLQVVIYLLGKQDPFVSVAVSLAALVFAFVLLVVIARFGGAQDRSRRQARGANGMTDISHATATTDTASPSRSRTCIAGTARSTRSTGCRSTSARAR